MFKTLGDSLRANPENYAYTRPALEKRIFSYETAYMGVSTLIIAINNLMHTFDYSIVCCFQVELTNLALVDLDWKNHNKKECGLTIGKPLPYGDRFGWVLQKNSPWTKFVNDRYDLPCSLANFSDTTYLSYYYSQWLECFALWNLD